MALNIQDGGADQLVRELAAETGETIATAVTVAVRERLERLRGAVPRDRRRRELARIAERSVERPVRDQRSPEELLGYGPDGRLFTGGDVGSDKSLRRASATGPTVVLPEGPRVLDTSALVAALFREAERDQFIALLAEAEDPLISAATWWRPRSSWRPRPASTVSLTSMTLPVPVPALRR